MRQAWDNVNTLMKDLRPFLERGKVSCKMPTGDITQISIDKYNEVFDFIHNLLDSDEWEEVQKAWSLCPPERWQWYEDYEVEGLQEQHILNFACQKLARLWKQKPSGFFNKHIESV